MPLKCPLYDHDKIRIYRYDDGAGHVKYRIVFLCYVQNSGLELDADEVDLPVLYEDDEFDLPEKAIKNLTRARNRIFELAFCNHWDWFFTGTLSPEKRDRTDLTGFRRAFSMMVRNLKRRSGSDVRYLLVPELHGDGASWHVHGFLSGLPDPEVQPFVLGVSRMSSYIASKLRRGQAVYRWPRYEKSFGFCDLEPIASHDGACAYVTKYIRKSLDHSVTQYDKHLFYASQGLRGRTRVCDAPATVRMYESMMQDPRTIRHEHGAVLWLDQLPEWVSAACRHRPSVV